MKKLITTVLLLFVINVGFSQVFKWRSQLFSLRQMGQGNVWNDWTPWNSSSVLITADSYNQRVKVFSPTLQTYDMIDVVTKNTDRDGNPIYSVTCVDENSTRCKMVWYHSAEQGSYVIFEFSNLEMMYKVVPLDN